MATTTGRPATVGTEPMGALVQAPRRRWRPGLMLIGLMLTAFAGLATAWLVASSAHRVDVLVVARDVPYGSVLGADDVMVTAVGVDAVVGTVPAAGLSAVVGQVATSDLRAGQLLAPGQVRPDGPPGAGQVLVALPVPADRFPAGGLHAGDRLLVADAPVSGGDVPTTTPATFRASVVRVGEPDLNGVVVLDVVAQEADGPALAARAASGRFALVLLGGSGQ